MSVIIIYSKNQFLMKQLTVSTFMMSKANLELIRKAGQCLGYSKLKKEQEMARLSFISGIDVFVSLPTGYGESLCFALLPRVFDLLRGVENQSIAIVVSPLIALMEDQVATFTSAGLSAAYVNDENPSKDTQRMIKRGEYQLVFISPEALFKTLEWRAM